MKFTHSKGSSLLPQSLFTTIFFWFLLAAGAIFFVVIGSAYLINRTVVGNQAREDLTLYLDTYGESVITLFEEKGSGETRHLLFEIFRKDSRFMPLLFDAKGEPLFERGRNNMSSMPPPPPNPNVQAAIGEEGKVFFDDRSAVMARRYTRGEKTYFLVVFTKLRPLLDKSQSKTALLRSLLLLGGA
ncbi:MAG TPA: hypothetical protein PK364_15180, partial [Synergistaceae bacterium]|nr:hypothetical protein [Synergistaceae bacterium]